MFPFKDVTDTLNNLMAVACLISNLLFVCSINIFMEFFHSHMELPTQPPKHNKCNFYINIYTYI
jgi:hypothetical protein